MATAGSLSPRLKHAGRAFTFEAHSSSPNNTPGPTHFPSSPSAQALAGTTAGLLGGRAGTYQGRNQDIEVLTKGGGGSNSSSGSNGSSNGSNGGINGIRGSPRSERGSPMGSHASSSQANAGHMVGGAGNITASILKSPRFLLLLFVMGLSGFLFSLLPWAGLGEGSAAFHYRRHADVHFAPVPADGTGFVQPSPLPSEMYENNATQKVEAALSLVPASQRSLMWAMPQFLIIGVQKCGTSALYFGLCQHPNITCSAYVKEPFFLSLPMSAKYAQSYQSVVNPESRLHYHKQYVGTVFNVSMMEPGQMTMEASTTYINSPVAFEIISNHLMNSGRIKLLVILREPVTRAYSHFQHEIRRKKGASTMSFADAIEDELNILRHCREMDQLNLKHGLEVTEDFDYASYYRCVEQNEALMKQKLKRTLPGYLLKGLYYAQLQKWVKAFPGRILVILHDNFRSDPIAVLNSVQQFLDLPFYNFGRIEEDIRHEFQEGSKYDKFGGPIIRELAREFAAHNDLLSQLLGVDIAWNRNLAASSYVIPV